MTDQEVAQAMTDALRSLNDLLDRMKMVYAAMDSTCPICNFAKTVTGEDIETVEALRRLIIKESRSSNRDAKLIAITAADISIEALTDKMFLIKTMADISHQTLNTIAEARIEGIIAGHEGRGKKETLDNILKNAGIPITDFDPTKVN